MPPAGRIAGAADRRGTISLDGSKRRERRGGPERDGIWLGSSVCVCVGRHELCMEEAEREPECNLHQSAAEKRGNHNNLPIAIDVSYPQTKVTIVIQVVNLAISDACN